MSVYNTAFRGAMPLGNLAAGSVADHVGAAPVVIANGVLLILVALWYFIRDDEVVRL
jgi:predicted MFS family arabinose efflux permease